MKLAEKIVRTITITAIVGMLAAPALANTGTYESFLAGKGHGPGDGTGTGDGTEGNGPGECDLGAIEFTLDNVILLAKDGAGGQRNRGANGGNGSGDRTRSQKKDGTCLDS